MEIRDTRAHIILDDCLNGLKYIESESIHLCLTDPPYFIDGMCNNWDHSELSHKKSKAGVIGGLPVGMKFDIKQGIKLQQFMENVSSEIFRVLKPGGFYLCFSQARLYHRIAIAIENSGFEIRDMMGWKYDGQAKAFSQEHFVKKKCNLSEFEKQQIIEKLGNRKTPQLKPQIEPIVLAQKPKIGTFVDNWMMYETGLIDTSVSLDGSFPGNIIVCKKPSKSEKGEYNDHLTVKPLTLLEHLIKIFSKQDQIVLDPFMGSGSTLLATYNCNRICVGFEQLEHNFNLIERRYREHVQKSNSGLLFS